MFQSPIFNRRQSIARAVSIGGTIGMSQLLQSIAAVAGGATENDQRHCVLLWMSGGPSQLDTFDMKPKHKNGGSFKEIATAVPGLRFSEHLPQLAELADQLAILRGMATKEGDHQRGTTVMRTGHLAGGPVRYPAIGCSLSKSLRNPASKLPHYVTVAPGPFARGSQSPGFLGPKFAATSVSVSGPPAANNFAQLRVDHLQPHGFVDSERFERRLALWESMQASYLKTRNAPNIVAQDTVYRSAIDMLGSDAKDAFDLSAESETVREAYGRGTFGQGCLMARRLIERGVPLVEVTLGDGLGWDTHANNFEQVQRLCEQLDAGWATLMTELSDRGLLEKTTILWAGEFGRTPAINSNGGRDHFPQAFSCVLAGGGVAGGQAFGATSPDGMEVIEGKIDQQDLLATLCKALGVDPKSENIADGGRPIAISEGNPIDQVLL
ncbi:DUF1501 domain-containing protein [Stieleria sp. ICT_E10.1]|uniref:DUF1501 domain-containing protein n=1 Tax=Stieleria sedimenti TaxID=2976331 RepID=UPI00218047C5|nr:DUF1501 domain-containing protein [Stieleria sedimenti]MCS7469355.1 DUF1501 domain-containing protein [Stieleria sedimenti]